MPRPSPPPSLKSTLLQSLSNKLKFPQVNNNQTLPKVGETLDFGPRNKISASCNKAAIFSLLTTLKFRTCEVFLG